VPSLSQDARFTYVTSPVAGIPDYLAMNTAVASFDDLRVRQAALVLRSSAPVNTTSDVNPELDALIDTAAAGTDMAERMDLYRQIREMALTDAPLVFTHFETLNYLMSNTVAGSTITPTLSLHMEDVGFTR